MHKTIPIKVWVDVDEEIADFVLYLNTIPGVRTLASCQGTLDEGGPNPYRPQVMITWDSDKTFNYLSRRFDITELKEEGEPGSFINNWGYIHPEEV